MNTQTESVLPYNPNKVKTTIKGRVKTVTIFIYRTVVVRQTFCITSLAFHDRPIKTGPTGLPHSTEKETES